MIKAIFFDIDGTLLSFKTHAVHPSTLRALQELRQRGVRLFISTGRHELLINNLDTSLFDGIVSLNGQCVRIGGKTIHANAMTAEDARSAVDFVTEHRLATIFEGIDFMRLNLMTDLARKGAALLDLRMPDTQDVSDIPDYPMLQLIVFCSPEQEAGLIARMPSCETTRWTPLLCDVMPRGGGKHVGIRKTLDYYGFSREESMAFGDGENDISMLQYVGLGVAMGNADAEVKAAADYVTTGTDDGGIAKALRRFGLISG